MFSLNSLFCRRPRCYYSTNKTPVRDRIFKWTQFMLQWFIRFPEFADFSEYLFHLGTTPKCTKIRSLLISFSATIRIFNHNTILTIEFFFAFNPKLPMLSTLASKALSKSKKNYPQWALFLWSLISESNAPPTVLTCHFLQV